MKGTRRSESQPRARCPAARAAVTLAALLAVFLQAFVIQTHVHAAAANPAAIAQAAADTARGGEHVRATHHQIACDVCLLAHAGRAALPDAPALAAPPRVVADHATPAIRAPPRTIALAWQSRAPPIAV